MARKSKRASRKVLMGRLGKACEKLRTKRWSGKKADKMCRLLKACKQVDKELRKSKRRKSKRNPRRRSNR